MIGDQRSITAISITESETEAWIIELTLDGDATETITIAHDANGDPSSISANGVTIPITYSGVS